MRDDIKSLKGSPYRDATKTWHKQLPGSKGLYAIDNDLMLIQAGAPTLTACLDAKKPGNGDIKWAHEVTYNWYNNRGIPVYLVSPLEYQETRCQHCGHVNIEIDEESSVDVIRFNDMTFRHFETPQEYVNWEKALRHRRRKRK